MKVVVSNLILAPGYTQEELLGAASKQLGVPKGDIVSVVLTKKSLDARKKSHIVWNLGLVVELSSTKKLRAAAAPPLPTGRLKDSDLPRAKQKERVAVVGFGPSGMFAALLLAELGYCPIVLERGGNMETRQKAVHNFNTKGILDENNNLQFGEGGAGTFSDGKLTTGTHNPHIGVVLRELHHHGAPEEILYLSKPHIGTDHLAKVVVSVRNRIEKLGGTFYFGTKVADVGVKGGALKTLVLEGETTGELAVSRAIFAVGHSARDTYQMLLSRGVVMQQKPFAIGVRVEHLQADINRIQYGANWAAQNLPPAEYKLVAHLANGRTAYSFCMCPGGTVVNAASETGGVVSNGMSTFSRGGKNANSALLVSVHPQDFLATDPLAGVRFQQQYEQRAFLTNKQYRLPAQTLADFQKGRVSGAFGKVQPSCPNGVEPWDMGELLPAYVTEGLKEGMLQFDKKMRGFQDPHAVLTGVETRSSAPVTWQKDNNRESSIRHLFPAGEGAGYAGGIMSAAVDGIRAATALILSLNSKT